MHLPPTWMGPADGAANRPPLAPRASGLRPRLWLIAGTGEGPLLAQGLLARGWRLRVSLVTPAAARAYRPHADLELQLGPLGESAAGSLAQPGPGRQLDTPVQAVLRELLVAERRGDPFHCLVDATHPFATRISAALAQACRQRGQPLLRLQRPGLDPGRATVLADLEALRGRCRAGERLLLAIGARQLAAAMGRTPEVLHHARVLPSPQALQQALACGLAPDRLACLRPGPGSVAIETALCSRWCIETVLCRQSGGDSEGRWHQISEALGLRLLLLRRPQEPEGVPALPLQALLERIGEPVSSVDAEPAGPEAGP